MLLETRDAARAARFAAATRSGGLTPSVLEIAWPDGRVVARYDSTAEAAKEQAVAAAAHDADATVLSDSERRMLGPRVEGRPWTADGPVVGVGVPLARVADLLGLAAEHADDLALRAGVGVGEARLKPDADAVAAFVRGIGALGGHVAPRRGPAELLGDAWPEGDPVARSLALAVKRQFDPRDTLSPGRLAEAA